VNYYYYYTGLMASFQDNLGKPVPERQNSLDLNEARCDGGFGMQWYQLDYMHTICAMLQTSNDTNTSSPNFYKPNALSDTQPTVSKQALKAK